MINEAYTVGVPVDWDSAYRPLEYEFKTNRYPNSRTFTDENDVDTGLNERQRVFYIGNPEAGDYALYPTLKTTDVVMKTSSWVDADILPEGQHFRLTNIVDQYGTRTYTKKRDSSGQYYGVYRVVKVMNLDYFVISAEYDGNYFAVPGQEGNCSKYYNNYQIKVEVFDVNDATGIPVDEFRVRPSGAYNLSQFTLDIKGSLQPLLQRHLEPLRTDSNGWGTTDWVEIDNRDTSVTYKIEFYELFDVPTNGINSLTQSPVNGSLSKAYTAVNAIKPQITFEGGKVKSIFTTALADDFLIVSGGLPKRFLTNAPSTQSIRRDHYASLTYMTDVPEMRLVVKTYPNKDLGGTLIATHTTSAVSGLNGTGQVLIGPANIGVSRITAATKSYQVYLEDGSGTLLTEKRTYNIDDDCSFSAIQFFWLNQLGGIDQYTFKGHSHEKINTVHHSYRQEQAKTFPTANTVNYWTDITKDLSVGTRVTRADADWTSELYMSSWAATMVYYTNGTIFDEFIPIEIAQQTIKPVDTKDRSKVTLNIVYRYAFDLMSQRG